VVISSDAALLPRGEIHATEVKQLMLDHIFRNERRDNAARNMEDVLA
jgi:hypothetical protein